MQLPVQQSKEWLELRKSKLGASDAPIIMKVSPWKTPYQLWLEKLSTDQTNFCTSSMQRGLDLEESARECFEEMTGLVVFPSVLLHKENDWMMASLDGIDIEQKNIVEIKCPNKEDHSLAVNGRIPEKYIPQLQHQLAVCELDMAYYFSFDGLKGVIVNVYRDEPYINRMIQQEREFYDCMQNFIAPEMTEKDYLIKSDDISHTLACKLFDIKKRRKELEVEEDLLQSDLIRMCQSKNTFGKGFKLTKIMRKGSVEYSRIPELKEVNLENYRKKPTEMWRVTSG